jgi:hypothetical protein
MVKSSDPPPVLSNCAENWMLYVPALAMTIRLVGVPIATPSDSSVVSKEIAVAVSAEMGCVVESLNDP